MIKKDTKKAPAKAKKKKRQGALGQARAVMAKIFKDDEDSVVAVDENRFKQSHPHLPSGSSVVDHLIGGIPNRAGVMPCPGFPRGRLVNVYGAEASGKTTLALHVAAKTCENGGEVCYIDWEHAIDIAYAKSLGVPVEDPEQFLLVQPETLEKGMAYLWGMAKAGVDLVVIDSVAAGATQAQWDQKIVEKGEIGRVGAKAAKWSEYLPQLKAMISRTNTCVVGISQIRSKINTGGGGYGGPSTTEQGGWAWKFYSELRMTLRRVGTEKSKVRDMITRKVEDVATANKVVCRIDKCKVSAAQGRQGFFFLEFGSGIDDLRSMIEIAVAYGVINKTGGGWYSWELPTGTVLKEQGLDKFKATLRENGKVDDLKELALQALASVPTVATTQDPDDIDVDAEVVSELQGILDGKFPGSSEGEPNPEEG